MSSCTAPARRSSASCRSSKTILASKAAVVSTTEELSYPGYTRIRQARQIDAWAKKAKVAVLGDRRQSRVRDGRAADHADLGVRARRSRDGRTGFRTRASGGCRFSRRSAPDSRRTSSEKKVEDGSVRHVGMTESIAMIADALGWSLDRITDDVQPKLATVTVASEFMAVEAGSVCGIVQDGIGFRKRDAGHSTAPGGLPRSAGDLRRGGHRRITTPLDEACRAAFTATSPRPRSRSTRSRGCSPPRPAFTPCATCRCRRSFPGWRT